MAFKGHKAVIYALAVAPDGYTTASCSGDHTIKSWDLRERTRSEARLNFIIEDMPDQPIDVVFSPDSRYIALGFLDNSVELRNNKTGGLLHRLKAHSNEVFSVRFSPDSQTLISASLDSTIRTWDISEIENRLSLLLNKQLKLHRVGPLHHKLILSELITYSRTSYFVVS